jgi:hypothetical protein
VKIKSFAGINNVADETRLAPGEMSAATNVDIGANGNLLSRRGRTPLHAGLAGSVFEAPFGVFALIDNNLVLLDEDGTLLRVVYDTIGYTRVWYVTLPDGRVAFSNGLVNGLATLTTTTDWGVPTPVDAGVGAEGPTLYQITYVRTSDGLEGPPSYGTLIDTTQTIVGLPQRSGYSINVYFAPYGEEMFLAGNTTTDSYLHGGTTLTTQHLGQGLSQPPAGILLHSWASRVLIADGSTLWATRPFQPELIDLTQDFLQFPDSITLIYGNSDGIFVGTQTSMYFAAGTVFSELKAQAIAQGPVALGSSVEVDLSYLNEKVRPSNTLQGALCLLDGAVHLLHGSSQILGLTSNRYRNTATEVYATTRLRDGVMQYIAAPA